MVERNWAQGHKIHWAAREGGWVMFSDSGGGGLQVVGVVCGAEGGGVQGKWLF